MAQRNCTDMIHCSKQNKILLSKHCLKVFLEEYPQLQGSHVTQNQLLTSLIRYYLADDYDACLSEVMHDIHAARTQ